MSDTTYVGRNIKSFKSSPEFPGFSKVVIAVTDELEYVAGTDTGRTLTLTCPWGTQAMADNILDDIAGYKYHPYNATGALLDPSAEIGDGVTVNGVYSGIYTMDVVFVGECRADISAPTEEEIDHEYPYVSKQERTINRRFSQVESEFNVQAGLISAKVSKTGGNDTSFGWELDEKSWTLKSKGKNVLVATKDGVEITGKITATSGKIGGFEISSDYLSYNKQHWGGTNNKGAYLGVNGLQLGKSFSVDMQGKLRSVSGEIGGFTIGADSLKYKIKNDDGQILTKIYLGPNGLQLGKGFRVDMDGNISAQNGTFGGTVYAKNISHGGNFGTLNGSAITAASIGTSQFKDSINTALGYANTANKVFNGNFTAAYIKAATLSGNTIYLQGEYALGTTQISYKDSSDSVRTLNVVTWSAV